MSVVGQRDKIVVGDNDVIGKDDADGVQRRLQRARGIQVFLTWKCVAARLVVGQNNGRGILIERRLNNFAYADGSGGDAAAVNRKAGDGLALRVQTQQIDDLFVFIVEKRNEVLPAFAGGVQDPRRTAAVDEMPPFELRNERDELRGAVSHAVYLYQLVRCGFQNAR